MHHYLMNADFDFLCFLRFLRDLGRGAAGRWLRAAWGDLGVRSSVDVFDKFL